MFLLAFGRTAQEFCTFAFRGLDTRSSSTDWTNIRRADAEGRAPLLVVSSLAWENLNGSLSVVVLACGGCFRSVPDSPADDQSRVATWGTSHVHFGRIAEVRPRPAYPVVSPERGRTGVAVVEVVTTEDGRVDRVNVLEAPDAHIGDAVSRALGQWEIPPPTDDDGQEVRVRAKLFFYFVIENGKGFVRSPEEMLQKSGSMAPAAAALRSAQVTSAGSRSAIAWPYHQATRSVSNATTLRALRLNSTPTRRTDCPAARCLSA